MNYKELFKIALLLISSPAKAWEEISHEEDKRSVFSSFVYPMIGLCGLSVFIGSLIEVGMDYREAMTRCCAVFVSLFGGYFLAAYVFNKLGAMMFQQKDDVMVAQQFVGYAMVVTFLLNFITGIVPTFLPVLQWIFPFYTIYIVWEGLRTMFVVDEKNQMTFTLVSSAIMILCPIIIKLIFSKLTTITLTP